MFFLHMVLINGIERMWLTDLTGLSAKLLAPQHPIRVPLAAVDFQTCYQPSPGTASLPALLRLGSEDQCIQGRTQVMKNQIPTADISPVNGSLQALFNLQVISDQTACDPCIPYDA